MRRLAGHEFFPPLLAGQIAIPIHASNRWRGPQRLSRNRHYNDLTICQYTFDIVIQFWYISFEDMTIADDGIIPTQSVGNLAMRTLRGWIQEGQWAAGDKLPGEVTLAGRLQVSRPTLRFVLKQLEHEGLVQVLPGRGRKMRGRIVTVDKRRDEGMMSRTIGLLTAFPGNLPDDPETQGAERMSPRSTPAWCRPFTAPGCTSSNSTPPSPSRTCGSWPKTDRAAWSPHIPSQWVLQARPCFVALFPTG